MAEPPEMALGGTGYIGGPLYEGSDHVTQSETCSA